MNIAVEQLGPLGKEILARASRGEPIVISKEGRPCVTLEAKVTKRLRPGGMDEGRLKVPDDFNDPLPDDVLGDMGG